MSKKNIDCVLAAAAVAAATPLPTADTDSNIICYYTERYNIMMLCSSDCCRARPFATAVSMATQPCGGGGGDGGGVASPMENDNDDDDDCVITTVYVRCTRACRYSLHLSISPARKTCVFFLRGGGGGGGGGADKRA